MSVPKAPHSALLQGKDGTEERCLIEFSIPLLLQEYGTKYENPALKCQNPWFLPFEEIDDMWNIKTGSN